MRKYLRPAIALTTRFIQQRLFACKAKHPILQSKTLFGLEHIMHNIQVLELRYYTPRNIVEIYFNTL